MEDIVIVSAARTAVGKFGGSLAKIPATELGAQGLLQRVVAPLAQTIGDLWRDGTITAAHEHFVSAVIRVFLDHAM